MWHVLYGLPLVSKEPGERKVRLHNGDDFTPRDEPPTPERLRNIRAITGQAISPLEASGERATMVEIDASQVQGSPAWVVAETSPMPIQLAPEKFLSYLGHEGLSGIIARREASGCANQPGREVYSKYIKVALPGETGATAFLAGAVGLPVEIVPLSAGPIQVGGALRVCVLFRGSPAAGLQLRVSNREHNSEAAEPDVLGTTDTNGEFEFSLSRPGYWRLHTIVMLESATADADWESWWACLTFSLTT
jgi:hypothetical protein